MKKIAIMSPTLRIYTDGKSARSVDALCLKKYLERNGDAKVYFVSKKIKEVDDYIDIFSLDNLDEFDTVYIHNAALNFFGGLVRNFTIAYLRLISNFKGEVFYFITDPKLTYRKSGTLTERLLRNWNTKTFEIPIERSEMEEINEKFKKIEGRMKAFFTGYNYEPVYGHDFVEVVTYNLFKDSTDYMVDFQEIPFENKQYDICYYGDNRGSYRNNKIKKFFDTDKIKTMTIGCSLPIKNNTFIEKQQRNDLPNIVQQSYSALVIGDKIHENAFITMRFYENIKMRVVSFIDINYDTRKLLFKDPLLKEFNYISSQDELVEKINRLKSDKQLYYSIIEKQTNELR